jgi:CRISPR-associated endoribonuclease Cas6
MDHFPHQSLPITYQYLISAWIYKTLAKSNGDFADWLHEQGYERNGRRYKLFCFSELRPKRYKIHGKENVFELVEGPTHLELSFLMDDGLKYLVSGLFSDNLVPLKGIGQNILLQVKNVDLIRAPSFQESMNFSCMTPIGISVSEEGKKHAQFIEPTDDRYADNFAYNLVHKANAYLGEEKYHAEEVHWELISEKIKHRKWTIKGIDIKGKQYDFKLTAPSELIRIGYFAGFGIQNSALGMGMVRIKNERR